jgi:hypothetical protein
MSDEDKKKFFNAVDTAYKAKSEGRLTGYNEAELTAGQKKIDVDGDGEIEGSDLAALRAKNESVNEAFSDNKNLNYIMKGKKIKNVVYDDNIGFAIILDNGKYIRFDTHSAKPGMVKDLKMESVNEENPGLWANIRAKQARGEAPAPKNSKAYKDAVEAGDKIKNEQSIKREALKSIVKEVMQEEAEYQKFFQKVLDKAGKSIPSMSDDEKKAFFNKVDSAWKGKQEGK